jgi:hypothetical protein
MKLDPRWLPRSYPELLQDVIAMHANIDSHDTTEAKRMATMLEPAVVVAREQLDRITQAAIARMIGGQHG